MSKRLLRRWLIQAAVIVMLTISVLAGLWSRHSARPPAADAVLASRAVQGSGDVPHVAGVARYEASIAPRPDRPPSSPKAAPNARRARLFAKLEHPEDEAFDEPDRAVEFYVNSRTGSILTRGPNPTTGVRPLDPAQYLPALDRMRAMPRFDTGTNTQLPPRAEGGAEPQLLSTWTPLGPGNQGGRTRALLIHPTTPTLMYAGGVAGGVWRTTDGGTSWTPLTDLLANIAIGTLAFDPQNTNTIYAGTGEGYFNGDAIRGAGIFRSTDAGATWTQLASTNAANFYYTTRLMVSPRNSQRLFATTRAGLFRSTDGGGSWSQIVNGAPVNGCTDMAMQVQGATGYVFFSCGNFAQATVYRILDDDTATQETILSLAGMARSAIAVAPSNEAFVYVLSAQATAGGGPGQHGLHGVYRSTANGDPGSFTTQRQGNIAPATTEDRINQLLLSNPVYGVLSLCGFGASQYINQGWYDNVIAVDPADPNRVWAGGVDLWRSDNGGVDWGTAGFWWFSKGADPEYHHADQHAIVFHPQYNGTSNRIMFAGSDGGVDRVDDARAPVNTTLGQICGSPVAGSPTWIDRNNGYVTTQFYAGVPYPNGQSFFGGLQDNGTLRGTSGNQNWAALLGGDGGYTAVDTLGDVNSANDVLFGEFTGLSIQRSVNGGASFSQATSGISDGGFAFIAPFTMNQGTKQQLWTGGWYIWRTINQAANWTRASAITAGNGSISAIAAHPLDGNRVLVGMSDGYIHYTTTGLSNTSGTTWPNTRPTTAFVSWIAWDPTDTNVAYATVSTFGGTTLFKTVNAGTTWTSSMGAGDTALPSVPGLSVVVNPDNVQQVFVGTDLGVFVSLDGGGSWLLENAGFARTPVEALAFNETPARRLFAFTHGRGAWSVATGCPAISVAPASLPSGLAGAPYSEPLLAAGGTAPYSFVVETGGVLPPGLVLSPDGVLGGTPTAAGTFNFTVRAMDVNSCPGARAYTVAIGPTSCPGIGIAPPALPNGMVSVPYSQTLTAVGGTGPYSFAVSAGSLPAGLSLSPEGLLSGSPTSVGMYNFVVSVSGVVSGDVPNGCSGDRYYTVVVDPPSSPPVTRSPTTTTVVFEPGPYVYRGTPFVATAKVTGPGGLDQSLPVTYTGNCTVPTVADGCTASASYAGDAAYPASASSESITIQPPTDPQPATDLRVDSVNGLRVRFRWTPPQFGPPPDSYVLEAGPSSATVLAMVPTDSASAVFEAVVPEGTWVAWIRSAANGTLSGRSNEVPVIVNVPVRPSAPVHFTGVVSGSNLGLSWKNTFEGGPPTDLVLDVSGSVSTSLPLALGESFALSGVPAGTYTFRLRAANDGGSSEASAPVTLTVPSRCSAAPQPPVNLLAYTVGSVVTVLWDPPATGAAPTSYVLNVTGSFVGAFSTAERQVSAPVGPGRYTISIAAVNGCGTSLATAPQTVVVP